MINVLITSASRKVALVKAFQTALSCCGGGIVIAIDVSPYAPALYVADKHFLIAQSTEPRFVDDMISLCVNEGVRLVVPTRDEELLLFAQIRQRFEEVGVKVMVPSPETVQICQDKLAFLEFCNSHNFGIPLYYPKEEWIQAQYPLFAKPRFGKGGKGATRINDQRALSALADQPGDWIVQEYVDTPEFTVDLFADWQGRVLSVVPRLRQFVLAGESYISRTVREPYLIAESARLARSLGLLGHNTIQCFWDGHQARFIEVNPRFGGASALGFAAGAHTPTLLLRLLQGEVIESQIGIFEEDLVMLRFTEDIFMNASLLLAQR